MLRKEVFSQVSLAFLYALVVTLLGRYFRLEFSIFWLGLVIGVCLLYLDPLVSAYFNPSGNLRQEFSDLWAQKKFKQAAALCVLEHQKLIQPLLHSALFQSALTFLAFYIVTSSTSFLGRGLVVGMLLHLIKDELEKWKDPEGLKKILFWNIHREIEEREQKIYLVVIIGIFLFETSLLI